MNTAKSYKQYKHVASFKRTKIGNDISYGNPGNNIIKLDDKSVTWGVGTSYESTYPLRVRRFKENNGVYEPVYDTSWVINNYKGTPITYRYEYGKWNIKSPKGEIFNCTFKIYKYIGIYTNSPGEPYCPYYAYEYYMEHEEDNTKLNDSLIQSIDSPLISQEEPKVYHPLYKSSVFSWRTQD